MTAPKNTREQQVIKVAIVEDKTWLRENLEQEINQSPQMRCLRTYATAELAIEDIQNVDPDVVIMDINLPKMDGVECVRRIKALRPEVRCLMLTVYEEADRIFNSLLAGASGYVLKRTSSEELLEAIRQVSSGGSPMSSSIARKVVDYFNVLGAQKSETDLLSPREQQVLELLARGAAYKDIADQLSLSIETIRMNVKHIYAKLHVHSRGEAAAKYLRSRSLGNR